MPSINDSKCFLIIGATSGLGRALARSIQALPSKPKVIVAGRRQDRLDELAREKFETIQVNIDTDRETLKKFVEDVLRKFPDVGITYILEVLWVVRIILFYRYLTARWRHVLRWNPA